MVKNIKIADFDYPLPDERVARHPLAKRDECKLLVYDGRHEVSHDIFKSLPTLLPESSLLVCNDTRVINARIRFEKATGSRIEVFLLEPVSPEDYVLMFQARGRCRWSCMVGNLKRWKDHPLLKELDIDGRKVTLTATRHEAREGNAHEVEFVWDDENVTFASIVDAAGYIPIPPYLKRESEETDADDYQTVYARIKGSVAAPTAGLHFTPEVFAGLRARGIDTMSVTLHVGAGRPVTAVGTTSVRTLESLPYLGMHLERGAEELNVTQWEAYEFSDTADDRRPSTISALDALISYMDKHGLNSVTASTSIMIAPGFRWRIVDRMVTNFHQPQSTLLLLVSSFLGMNADGRPRWRDIYEEALAGDYRFLSYGDACLFSRDGIQ